MNQLIGEIRLFPYDDVPKGWLECKGQSLHVSKYPKLYMMIGNKFGKNGEQKFKVPDLTKKSPIGLIYCIATNGEVPMLQFTDSYRKDKINEK